MSYRVAGFGLVAAGVAVAALLLARGPTPSTPPQVTLAEDDPDARGRIGGGTAEAGTGTRPTPGAATNPLPDDRPPTAAEAAVIDRQVDAEEAEVRAGVPAQVSAYRGAMQSLCDALSRAALREPDYGSVYKFVRDVEQTTLRAAEGGDAVDPGFLASYRSQFVRTETQGVIDRMIAEARRQQDVTRRREREIAGLEARRPANRVYDRWTPFAREADAKLKEASAFVARPGRQPDARVASRADLRALLDRLEDGAAADRAAAARFQEELGRQSQRVGAFAAWAREFPGVVRDARALQAAIGGAAGGLEVVKRRDLAPSLTYHRRLIGTLPETMGDLTALNAFGDAVLKAKAREPAFWADGRVAGGYARWQSDNYDRLMAGPLGERVRAALAGHRAALEGPAGDAAWHAAAVRLSAAELTGLAEYAGNQGLEAERPAGRSAVLQMTEDATEELAVKTFDRPGDLVPVSPVAQARRVAGDDTAARAYHRAVIGRVLERGTLEAVADLVEVVASEGKARPSFWGDAVRVRYAGFQLYQWRAFCGRHVGEDVAAAAKAYFARNYWPDPREAFVKVPPPAKPTDRQIRGILALLDGGFLPARGAKGAKAVAGELSPVEFGGLRLGGANPGQPGKVMSGPADLPFWEDVLWLRESAAAKPALAAVNPYAATRLLGQDPATTPARRRYHVALLRRFNGNRTLADVAGMKQAIEAEVKKSPDDWAAPGWGGPYAALQADQWAAYFEQNLEKNAMVLGAYRNRPLGAAQWAKASGRWRPQAPAMLAFLRDGVLDRAALANRVMTFYNTKPPAPDYGQWRDLTDPAFWQAVQAGR